MTLFSGDRTALEAAGRWLRVGMEFAFSQGFAQAAGMLSGLIYVRVLPVDQYAIYAICLTSISTMALISDLGLSSSLAYFRREANADSPRFQARAMVVRRARFGLLVAGSVVGCSMILFSLRATSATRFELFLYMTLAVLCSACAIQYSLDNAMLRLSSQFRESYFADVGASLARLVMAVAMIATSLTFAWFGLASALLGNVVGWGIANHFRDRSGVAGLAVSADDRAAIARYVLPIVPSVLVYTVQDPILYWLAMSKLGTATVAEVFALGRISAIFALIPMFTTVVLVPKIAQMSSADADARATKLTLGFLLVAGAVILLIGLVAPQLYLMLLGPRYAHLQRELLLTLATLSIVNVSWYLSTSNRVRGWVALDPKIAMAQLGLIVCFCLLWPLSTTGSVLALQLALAIVGLAFNGLVSVAGRMRPWLVEIKS